jgi:hypothetical protein
MWKCPDCEELIEDNFDICWNCGTHMDGTRDGSFQREPVTPDVQDPSVGGVLQQPRDNLPRVGIAYSPFADFALLTGQGCALLGCAGAVIFGISCLASYNWIWAIFLAPISFFLSLANFVVFARVRRL